MSKSSHSGSARKPRTPPDAAALKVVVGFTKQAEQIRQQTREQQRLYLQPAESRKARAKASDFPLRKHNRGLWYKKVRGEFYYFGRIQDDPQGTAALNQWLNEKKTILAGRPRNATDAGLELVDLCNHFMLHKRNLKQSGELAPRTYDRYYNTCGHKKGVRYRYG